VEVRALSNTCLDVRDVSPADGAVIQLWECAGSANQHWTVPATGAGPVRGFAGKCLDADPTGAVRLWECTGAESQRWRYTAEGELRGPGELCLDVDESSLHAGAATTLAACTGTRHQKWRLV
jgi:hypothetical protein